MIINHTLLSRSMKMQNDQNPGPDPRMVRDPPINARMTPVHLMLMIILIALPMAGLILVRGLMRNWRYDKFASWDKERRFMLHSDKKGGGVDIIVMANDVDLEKGLMEITKIAWPDNSRKNSEGTLVQEAPNGENNPKTETEVVETIKEEQKEKTSAAQETRVKKAAEVKEDAEEHTTTAEEKGETEEKEEAKETAEAENKEEIFTLIDGDERIPPPARLLRYLEERDPEVTRRAMFPERY